MENSLANALGQHVVQLAAEEKQRLMSRLLARLAHEIRNPLSSLHIHVQLLEEDISQLEPGPGEKLQDRLQIIHGEIHRLETIVKHFLRLSNPSELNLEPLDIQEMLDHLEELLAPEAKSLGVDLHFECAENLPRVRGDKVQLTQALLNLLINALQALESHGRIDVRVKHDLDSLFFEVHDTGPGIAEDKLATIFEPYYTTKPEGTGLGLWIVQQIASAHGGEVKASNSPEGGAIFTLRLPIEKTETADG